MATLKESSVKNWTSNRTIEHINAGSLQRIADAWESTAKSLVELIDTRDRKVANLRGQITKLKNAAKKEVL